MPMQCLQRAFSTLVNTPFLKPSNLWPIKAFLFVYDFSSIMILKTRATSQPPVLAFVILWLTGLYLRLPILVIPPLTAAIDDDFNLPQALLGSLTTLPILMLSVGAILGSLVIIHLGARTTLAMALALVGLASAARGLTDQLALLLSFSAFMGLGIAIMQPALPALLTRWLQPTQLALGSAVYMNGMLMGEFIGAGLTLPILMPWLNNRSEERRVGKECREQS